MTGWTWEYIDKSMTLPRWESMCEYWKNNPPQHMLMAIYIGYKPEKPKPKNDLGELMGMFKAMGGEVKINGRKGHGS